MAGRKSTRELMAMCNPLTRTSVMPIDIYNQAPEPPVAVPKPEQPVHTDEPPKGQASEGTPRKASAPKKVTADSEALGNYSTYLIRKSIKRIKFRALERDMKDYQILQEAVDEYFERHPDA